MQMNCYQRLGIKLLLIYWVNLIDFLAEERNILKKNYYYGLLIA